MRTKITKEQRGFDLKKLILSRYPSLPENQRKAADFLLQHLHDAPFFSIIEIEKRSGTSKATIVRLSQNLGYTGFQELRAKLMEGVQSAIQLAEKFPLLETADYKEALSIVAHQDVKNINQTINHIDRRTFDDVARMILRARHVYTLGLGISSLMSQILAYSLNQVAVRATAFVHDYETFLEQLAFVTPSDLVCAFSFPPYSKETLNLVATAKKKRIPVIGITDRLTAPITFYSKKSLAIRSQNVLFTNSFSAISVVINALVTEVAMRNKNKAMKMSKEIDQLLTDSGYYATE